MVSSLTVNLLSLIGLFLVTVGALYVLVKELGDRKEDRWTRFAILTAFLLAGSGFQLVSIFFQALQG